MNNEYLSEMIEWVNLPDVIKALKAAPNEVYLGATGIEAARVTREMRREDLRLAEANAEGIAWIEVEAIAAGADGKKMLADAKKARVVSLIGNDRGVQEARNEVTLAEAAYGEAIARSERARAGLTANKALADLTAALLRALTGADEPEPERR